MLSLAVAWPPQWKHYNHHSPHHHLRGVSAQGTRAHFHSKGAKQLRRLKLSEVALKRPMRLATTPCQQGSQHLWVLPSYMQQPCASKQYGCLKLHTATFKEAKLRCKWLSVGQPAPVLPHTTYSSKCAVELRWGVLQHMPGLLGASKGLKEAILQSTAHPVAAQDHPSSSIAWKIFQHQREGLFGPAKSTVPMQPSRGLP